MARNKLIGLVVVVVGLAGVVVLFLAPRFLLEPRPRRSHATDGNVTIANPEAAVNLGRLIMERYDLVIYFGGLGVRIEKIPEGVREDLGKFTGFVPWAPVAVQEQPSSYLMEFARQDKISASGGLLDRTSEVFYADPSGQVVKVAIPDPYLTFSQTDQPDERLRDKAEWKLVDGRAVLFVNDRRWEAPAVAGGASRDGFGKRGDQEVLLLWRGKGGGIFSAGETAPLIARLIEEGFVNLIPYYRRLAGQ